MSIWADIHRRSTGETVRKEDKKYFNIDEISEMLKSLEVKTPVMSFIVIAEYKSRILSFTAVPQLDGTKTFYSDNNVNKFKKFIESEGGRIIKIEEYEYLG